MLKKILLAALIVTSAAFAQVQVGGRIAFNYGGIWGDPESDEVDWGAGFIVGPEVKYSFNPMVSLISGLQLDYRRISYDYFVKYDRDIDPDLRNYTVTESISFMYLDVPVLLRVNPVSFFSINAGINFDFNLSANFVQEYDDETASDDVTASVKTFEFGLACGLGFELSEFELNFRAVFGMTEMLKKLGNVKHLRLQAGLTYWAF